MMFEAQTEWISPESFPDLKGHKYIAIDLETRDPGLKSKGSGALVGEGEIVGIAVAVEGWSGYYSFGHKEGNFLQNPKAIEDFLKKFGVAPEVSKQYMNSFTVKQMVNRGIKHSRQLKVSSVPMMIVDGKYIIEAKGSYENILKVVDYVVELQRPNS